MRRRIAEKLHTTIAVLNTGNYLLQSEYLGDSATNSVRHFNTHLSA
jgi:hypothetical protein